MTTYDRCLFRELLGKLLAVTSILTLVIAGHLLIRLSDKVAGGRYPADVLLPLLGLGSFDLMIRMLPFAAMIAALLTLARAYRDSEIYAAFSIRIGYLRIHGVLMRLGLPLALLLLYLVMEVSPAAKTQLEYIKESGKQRTDVSTVEAGRFMESAGNGVLFVERRRHDAVEGVFAAAHRGRSLVVETARRGRQLDAGDGRKLIELRDGRFYEGLPGKGGFLVSSYAVHSVRLPQQQVVLDHDDAEKMRFAQLWHSSRPEDRAELQWRLSVPLSLLLLLMLSVPLSRSPPRQGQHLRLAVGIVVFLFYSNLTGLLTGMIAAGNFPAVPGVWLLHAALLACIVLASLNRRGGGRGAAMAGGRA